MNAIDTLVKAAIKLPSPPAIAIKIIETTKKENCSYSELATIISSDPALSAKVLSLANSSFYGLPTKVESIEKAITVLGLNMLKNIALSFVIVKNLKGEDRYGFDHDYFWRRSVTAAVAAEILTKLIGFKGGDMFVTSLLMDIGIIIMFLNRPEDYQRVLQEKMVTDLDITDIERMVFGFDHQEVGQELLKRWGLSENIYQPIAYHHNPEECLPDFAQQAGILRISAMASSLYHGNEKVERFESLRGSLKERFGLQEAEIEAFVDEVAEKTVEVLSFFDLPPQDMKPYSQILAEANRQLAQLNLSYEQLVLELKDEKDKVEKLARELKEANDKLKELVLKDGLTGLFNHRAFQELLDRELQRAFRYKHPLSLAMLDVDHFKKVNDTFGHQQGDNVLRGIGEVFRRFIRKSDIAARYGGEEFAILLPETDMRGAIVMAERIRRSVEEQHFITASNDLKVTISIGIATYEPHKGIIKKDQLIEAADKALYNSKKGGRNKISVAGLIYH